MRFCALLLGLCLATQQVASQEVNAEDDAMVNTGAGNQVRTGDNSTVIIGHTIEQHEAALFRREAQIRADLERVSSLEQDLLRREIADIESKRADLQGSYEKATRELTALRNRLSDIGDGIPQQKIHAAKQALFKGDRSKADALFAEVEAMEQESIDRAAAAAFERGLIAEQEVRWTDAAKHYEKAARRGDDPEYLHKAGEFLRRAGKFHRAVRYNEDYLEAMIEAYGEAHAETASAMNNLALSYQYLSRFDEAEPLYRQAIEIDKATIGETHPDYAIRLDNLAGLLKQMNRLHEARPLLSEAVEVRKSALGIDHPDTLISVWWQADFARADRDFAAAEKYYRQVLTGFKNSLGTDHPNTKELAQQFGSLLREHFPGDPALAELEATFGPDIGQ